MLTVESLEAAGYRKFHQRPDTIRNASFGMQKRVDDEVGVRYFITFFVYDYSQFAHTNADFAAHPLSFAPHVQFRGDNSPTVDVDYHATSTTTIEQVESFYQGMWEHLQRPYNR